MHNICKVRDSNPGHHKKKTKGLELLGLFGCWLVRRYILYNRGHKETRSSVVLTVYVEELIICEGETLESETSFIFSFIQKDFFVSKAN
jgi:hypothetical protein